MAFAALPEQAEAKRLLGAALADGPAHAYLLHGPPGVGKRQAALAFAGAILGDAARVASGNHPDLYLLEPLGEMIRIDEIRQLRHDLHMRPYEADHRVYVIAGAHLLNEDAADALLKDLEEPPAYAVIVLVADDLGQLPTTILSRCQLVPFRRLSERAVRAYLEEHAPGSTRRSGRRSHASPAAGSTGRRGCSTRRLPSTATPCSRWPEAPTRTRSSSRLTPPRRCSRPRGTPAPPPRSGRRPSWREWS